MPLIQLPDCEWSADSIVPTSEALVLSGTSVYVLGMVASNIGASDATLTLKTNESSPVTKMNRLIAAGEVVSIDLTDVPLPFNSGIRWVTDQPNTLNVYLYGRKRFS